jgi:hypothetical protein
LKLLRNWLMIDFTILLLLFKERQSCSLSVIIPIPTTIFLVILVKFVGLVELVELVELVD